MRLLIAIVLTLIGGTSMFRNKRSIHRKLDVFLIHQEGTRQLLLALSERLGNMQQAIDELRTAVEEAKGVQASVKVLITEMATKLEAAADDPDEIRSLVSDLRASTNDLASAVQK